MFDFLFKRQGSKPAASGEQQGAAKPAPAKSGAAQPPVSKTGGKAGSKADNKAKAAAAAAAEQAANQAAAQAAEARAAVASARERQAAQLKALGSDEAAAAEFILQSPFSELRLAAAELLHGREHLERVYGAMRNVDRRVAKLVHGRLDAIRHHEAELRRAEDTLAQARAMLADALLTPNHVGELDRKWSVIRAPELAADFEAVRAQLGARLEAQVQLQRAMIDRLTTLRQLDGQGLDAAALGEALARLQQEQTAALADPGHPSLPRALVGEVSNEMARLTASLATAEKDAAALTARDAALTAWAAQPQEALTPDALRRDWQRLPAMPANAAATEALQARFDALLASLPQAIRKPKAVQAAAPADSGAAPAKDKGADQAFLDQMDALEAALQQGSLGTAAEIDKSLKDAKDKGVRLTGAQLEHLTHLRADLKRLSDWARWGGNVSREELIKTVETLATQNLAMGELAKKVGSMRERWKALDTLSGPAPRSLWERFDAACSAAYAPAAAHFRQLADERHANAARGQALVDEAQAEIANLQQDNADWKHVSATVQRLRTAWSHLGAVDRKEKKRLDGLFSEALTTLQRPLENQRKVEVAVREQLIEEVHKLDPNERHAVDMLRELQSRWQDHARALPLERKAEQALWQRFRAACDALFAARKEHAHAADSERRTHEAAKEALCARLEAAALDATPSNVARMLREAAAEWQAIGPVPRAHEARVEGRYQAAVAQVQAQVAEVRRAADTVLAGVVRDKLRLIQALETALADPDSNAGTHTQGDDWRARWAALAPVDGGYEPILQKRFDAALAALEGDRAAYARQLQENRPRLLNDLLRLEIAAGIDSGAEFARDRLRLQVEVLQSSLKSGQKPGGNTAELRALLALPALTDVRTETRIECLMLRQPKEAS
ncbi:hypothetical protein HD842_004627 [Massilia aurea]|uniref:DUF349 domain-containing protein n=1 Tax=Massilia aurea TaxID=373040 RepID=A0A7W9X4P3_9BURK|nr:DUF349 domain-containing protein [Massilia aurea]MBB6136449.1 hypothetical protein [Massilia aurea]